MIEINEFTTATPLKSIRQTCINCVDGDPKEVRDCSPEPCSDGVVCPLWEHRSGRKRKSPKVKPQKAIRQYCLWCQGGSCLLVRECQPGHSRPLSALYWGHRMGRPEGR